MWLGVYNMVYTGILDLRRSLFCIFLFSTTLGIRLFHIFFSGGGGGSCCFFSQNIQIEIMTFKDDLVLLLVNCNIS